MGKSKSKAAPQAKGPPKARVRKPRAKSPAETVKRMMAAPTPGPLPVSDQLTVVKCPKCHGPLVLKMTASGPAAACPCSHPAEFSTQGKWDYIIPGLEVPTPDTIVDEQLKLTLLSGRSRAEADVRSNRPIGAKRKAI